MTTLNRQWILTKHAEGMVRDDNFQLREVPVASVANREVLVRVRMISLDPALRLMVSPPTAARVHPPLVSPGEVMFGFGVGEVIDSRAPEFKAGDVVSGPLGWQTLATVRAERLFKRNSAYSPEELLGVLGQTAGVTAYYGTIHTLKLRRGESVVVSSAAGAVGSLAGQIAKICGCKAVGIAGGKEKCEQLVSELGFDLGIDYKAGGLEEQLRLTCPEGIDVYFDNVGGEILLAVAQQMRIKGRIGICGAISTYNDEAIQAGLRRLAVTASLNELQLLGFSVKHFVDGREEAEAELARWMRQGRLRLRVDLRYGLERLPSALRALFCGDHRGKLLVQIQ